MVKEEHTKNCEGVRRGVSAQALIISGIFTVIILGVAVYIGYRIETDTYNRLVAEIAGSALSTESYTLMKEYLELKGTGQQNESCALAKTLLDSQAARTAELSHRIYELESMMIIIDKERYSIIRNQYALANFRSYLANLEYERWCGDEREDVLFFYTAEERCPDCVAMGRVLDRLREECKGVRVYAFPIDVHLDILSLVRERYKIRKVPAIVIERNNTVFEGLHTYETIKSAVVCVPEN